MKPSTFEYHAPETIDEAVALLTELGDVEVHQGLRVRAVPERVADEIGVLCWEAQP